MAKKVEVEITGEDKLSGVIGGIQGSLAGLGKIALGVAAGGLAVLGAGLAGLGVFLKESVESAMESENVMAQLDAVLESTGHAAGVTADELSAMAEELQKTTKFSDDAIIGGQNILLTFTKIGKDVFPEVTEVMLDMSQALGQDLQASAMQLGKALNDPIAGVSALRKVGVAFTDEQEEMIKKMVEAGDVAGAQRLILAELSVEFGGSAEAAGKTFAGQLEILKNQLDGVKETVGAAVIPVLQQLIQNVIVPAIPFIEKAALVVVDLAEKFGRMISYLQEGGTLEGLLSGLITPESVSSILQTFGMTKEKADEWGTSISEMFVNVQAAAQPFLNFLDNMKLWWEANGPGITASASTMFASLQETLSTLQAKIGPFIEETLAKLSMWFVENGPLIQSYIAAIADVWTNLLMPAIVVVWDTILPILGGLIDMILGLVTFVMQIGTRDWAGAWETIKEVVVNAGLAIWEGIVNFLDGIAGLFDTSLNDLIAMWKNIFDMLPGVIQIVAGRVIEKATSMASRIVEGIRSGILNGWESLKSWFIGLVSGLLDAAKAALGIHSPSAEFALVGKQIMAGLGKGIGDGVSVPVNAITDSMTALPGLAAGVLPGTGIGLSPSMSSTSAGGISVVLQIQSPVTIMDERTAQDTLLRYIENGIRDLQARGALGTV